LGLRQVTGVVTKIDRRFAETAVQQAAKLAVPKAIVNAVQEAATA